MRKRWNSSCAVTTAWVFCTIFLWLPTRTFIFALRIAFSKERFDSKQELSSQLGLNCFESCHCPDMMGQFRRFLTFENIMEIHLQSQEIPYFCASCWIAAISPRVQIFLSRGGLCQNGGLCPRFIHSYTEQVRLSCKKLAIEYHWQWTFQNGVRFSLRLLAFDVWCISEIICECNLNEFHLRSAMACWSLNILQFTFVLLVVLVGRDQNCTSNLNFRKPKSPLAY